MVTLKQTFKKHGTNLPGFQKGKKETKMNDTYQSGLVHNPNHFLNMFSGPPLSLPDGLEPLSEILFLHCFQAGLSSVESQSAPSHKNTQGSIQARKKPHRLMDLFHHIIKHAR
jgi:hypothetical protein